MAESVKRRVAAARLAVAFVAAGTIAGAAAWAQAGPPPTAKESILVSSLKLKLGSQNIKNGSLLFKDFRKGQVPSQASFFKFKSQTNRYKAQNNSFKSSIKGEVDAIKGDLPSYIKLADADSRYLKLSQKVVEGDGSVFTGHGFVSNQLIGLLDVPGLISVEGAAQKVRFTNSSGGDLQHTACTDAQGQLIPAGTLKPGEFLECDARDGTTQSMQFFTGGAQPTIATVSFSSIAVSGGAQDTVQILIGL